MFTGIVEALGTLVEVKPIAASYRLRVQTALASEMKLGDSLAVNGVCLTVILRDGDEVHADVGPETARVTNLGNLQRGQRVNLERPMRLDGRLGGHIVLGHVDGIGIVDDVRRDSDSHWLTVTFPLALATLFIRKGSVAVDGISLTVAEAKGNWFRIWIIPHTHQVTNLRAKRPGDLVNLEADILGKYVAKLLATRR
jgi:riboflavin synthase